MEVFTLTVPESNPLVLYRNHPDRPFFSSPANCLFRSHGFDLYRFEAWGDLLAYSTVVVNLPVGYTPQHAKQTGNFTVDEVMLERNIAMSLGIDFDPAIVSYIGSGRFACLMEKKLKPAYGERASNAAWELLREWMDREIFKQWNQR